VGIQQSGELASQLRGREALAEQHVTGSDQVGAVMLKGHTLFLIDERSQKRLLFSFALG
jgi:hypothetical protein